MKVLTAAQMKEVDRVTSEDAGVPGAVLMENAGASVVRAIEGNFADRAAGLTGVICGKGNNGGDGFVVARRLIQQGRRVIIVLLSAPEALRGDAAVSFKALQSALEGVSKALYVVAGPDQWAEVKPLLHECTLLVDAIFGTGLSSPPTGVVAQIIRDLNAEFPGVPILAIDIPSGLLSDGPPDQNAAGAAIIHAALTVTFTAPKLGQLLPPGAAHVGRLKVEPIGTPRRILDAVQTSWFLSAPDSCRPFVRPRARDANKGDFGHVLVIGGSAGKSGAVAMAAEAALRMGAGLVTAAVPESVLPMVAGYRPELMTAPLEQTAHGTLNLSAFSSRSLNELLKGKTVFAVGPGISRERETAEGVRKLLASATLPVVLDADGLNAFAGRIAELHAGSAGVVLTPHPGEMGRLLEISTREVQSRRVECAKDLAARTDAVVVLKGQRTLVVDATGATYINPTGGPGMATGGSGDVLTGFIAGLLAQFPKAKLLESVAAAVYLHGLAGDLASETCGEMSMTATDITRHLAAAIRRIQSTSDDAAFDVATAV